MKRKKTKGHRAADPAKSPGSGRPGGRRDEPRAEGGPWVEMGGELGLEIGTKEGGAPYGLSVEKFRRGNEIHEQRAGWAAAKHLLEEVLPCEPSGEYAGLEEGDSAIGWVCLKAHLLLGTMTRYVVDSSAAETGRREYAGFLRRVLES